MTRKSIPVITFSVNILTMIEKTISHRGVHKKNFREGINPANSALSPSNNQ